MAPNDRRAFQKKADASMFDVLFFFFEDVEVFGREIRNNLFINDPPNRIITKMSLAI